MPVRRKVFRSGTSLAITLPPEMIARLGITEGSEVEVTEASDLGGIIVAPAGTELQGVDQHFARHVDGFIEQYRSALEALAKR